jgi:hypothetical protein
MRLQLVGTLFVLLASPPNSTKAAPQSGTTGIAPESCPVTLPRPCPAGDKDVCGSMSNTAGNAALFVAGLWTNGTVVFRPGGPGTVFSDGSLGMKFGWFRGPGLRGKLIIRGRRLGKPAPPLRSHVAGLLAANTYDGYGFQASMLIFPTVGCWEITGEVSGTKLTFVTRVIKSGALK